MEFLKQLGKKPGVTGEPAGRGADGLQDPLSRPELVDPLLGQDRQHELGHHGHDHSGGAEPRAFFGAARADAPRTKAQALARHQGNRRRVQGILRSALAQDAGSVGETGRVGLLRNAAQWIARGQADLQVLTPTHDSHLRPECPEGKSAYFDSRVSHDQDGADYDQSLNAAGEAVNTSGVVFQFSDVAGSMATDGVTLSLIDPMNHSEGELAHILIHEVQHDADQHLRGEAWSVERPDRDAAALDRAPGWAYNLYASELRSYWMMNPEGSSADEFASSTDHFVDNQYISVRTPGRDGRTDSRDDVLTTVLTAFDNLRQQQIFERMYVPRADNLYMRVDEPGALAVSTQAYAYLPHYYAVDPAFRAFVDGLTHPRGGNLLNSVRIQELSVAVEAGRIFPELSALESADFVFLRDTTVSQPFWDRVSSQLSFYQAALLAGVVSSGAREPLGSGESVRIVPGDTLSTVADRYLGDPMRWTEIYLLNRAAIGDDPGVVLPDMMLEMPAL